MPPARLIALAFLSALPALTAAPRLATAQITEDPTNPLPDPAKFSRGLFADAELGTLMFLGELRKPLGAGVGFGVRLGWDVFRWLAVQAHAFGSTHRTNFDGAPASGELLQVYQGTAELKLAIPIGRVSLVAFGGAGLAHLSTNILAAAGVVDERTSTVFLGGAGVDYHPLVRHLSFGLHSSFASYAKLEAASGVAVTTYLRYTF